MRQAAWVAKSPVFNEEFFLTVVNLAEGNTRVSSRIVRKRAQIGINPVNTSICSVRTLNHGNNDFLAELVSRYSYVLIHTCSILLVTRDALP